MTATVRTFRGADGVEIAADVHGDPANPPVVFLHGGGQTRHAWGDAAERFATEGYYTVTMDLRGHGDSGWAPNGVYDIADFVADLRAVLTQLPNATPAALVGASLGGVTSLLAVGTAEQPIARALVLVDIVPKINPEGAMKIHGFMSANPDGFASIEEAADAVSAYMPHRPRPKDVSGLKKNLRLRDGRYYWHWDPKFIFRNRDINPLQSRDALDAAARNVRVPTLLVKGSLSEIVDDEGVEEFRQVLPNAEVVDVKGAGHMVAGDKNNAFDNAVLDFLRRHDRA
jgi:pimeloyl-ACP methyl ester carboxylesterase